MLFVKDLPLPTSLTSSFLAPSSYAFVYDEKLPAERDELKAALKKAKGQAARADLQVRGGNRPEGAPVGGDGAAQLGQG